MTKVMVKSCAKDLVDIASAAERAGDATGEGESGRSAARYSCLIRTRIRPAANRALTAV